MSAHEKAPVYGEFKKIWDDMTNTKAPSKTNWVYMYIPDGAKVSLHELALGGSGEGGLPELKGKLGEKDTIAIGAFRVLGVDVKANVTSTRDKYVFFSYVSAAIGGVRRANVTGLKPAVIPMFLSRTHVSREFSAVADIDHADVANELLRIGGAHKPTKYDFGGELCFDVPAHT